MICYNEGMKKGVMMQYFEWYLDDDATLWQKVKANAKELSEAGFSALWLPPAYKGQAGIHDVGYGVYDLYDLGEFDQKGSIPTKYGTKDEYLAAIKALHEVGIDVYADMVFNHKMGADGLEIVKVVETNAADRDEDISKPEDIEAWTYFDFKGRQGKYSDFKWDKSCFSGVDYDNRQKKTAVYRLAGGDWDENVDDENGNYDYLMGADLDFGNPEVVRELYTYGKWYLDMCKVDGFRLDALKHIDASFFKGWLKTLRDYSHKELFTVGEYWHGDIKVLLEYLEENDHCLSLFDVPLHYQFYKACNDNGNFDMGSLGQNTLVKNCPLNAVTFVENHDTQKGQALETIVTDWFKPLAYAYILLREEGYPCVFYGDYYGIKKFNTRSFKKEIDLLIKLRHKKMNGKRHDYFDHFNIVGWTFEGLDLHDGMAVLINDGPMGEKMMYVGKDKKGQVYQNLFGAKDETVINENGNGLFKVDGGNLSVYINKVDCRSF